jgi:membrane-bound lytic murein transglycosylase
MKRFTFVIALVLVSVICLTGCAGREVMQSVRAAESTTNRTAEVIANYEIVNAKDLSTVEKIKCENDRARELAAQMKAQKKTLNAAPELYREIEYQCTDTRNHVERVNTFRKSVEVKKEKRVKRKKDIERADINAQFARANRRTKSRHDALDAVHRDLIELNKKMNEALGNVETVETPADETQSVDAKLNTRDFQDNITIGSPYLRRLPYFGNVPFAMVPSPSTSIKNPRVSSFEIA